MIAGDDPRSYRIATNAHPGMANSPLDTTASRWTRGRIRLVKDGLLYTRLIPEVYVERGARTIDPSTGVPRSPEGRWVGLREVDSGLAQAEAIVTGLPGGNGRLGRSIARWKALMRARAIDPEIVRDGRRAI